MGELRGNRSFTTVCFKPEASLDIKSRSKVWRWSRYPHGLQVSITDDLPIIPRVDILWGEKSDHPWTRWSKLTTKKGQTVIVGLQMSILPQSEIYTTLWNLRKFKTGQHFLKGVTCILQCQQHSRGRVRLSSKHGWHNGMPVARVEGCCPLVHGWDKSFYSNLSKWGWGL